MTSQDHDLIVVGAGPAGYVAALRAAQLGLNVACVEQEPALGGTCLRVGCIPSKALLESSERFHEACTQLSQHGVSVQGVALDLAKMQARKESIVSTLTKGVAHLFRNRGIQRYQGKASFLDPHTLSVTSGQEPHKLSAPQIIIATGSRASSLPGVPWHTDRVGTSTEALAYREVPRHLVVIGAGAIGLELGAVWARLGAKVTVLEALERILPGMDGELAREAERVFVRQGLAFRLGAKVKSISVSGDRCAVDVGESTPIDCDRVLVAVGRLPNTEGLELGRVGVAQDERGRIVVGAGFRTNVDGIYAVGDVIGGAMLAHKASDEGVACVEGIVSGYGHVNYQAIPAIVYTDPEIASVGYTEEQLLQEGVRYKKGVFPFSPNGRARALGNTTGRVKILADAETDRVLGVHVIGPRAGDLIAEGAVAIEFGASAEDIARASHAHPTLAEVVREAALAVGDRALHL